MYTGELLGPSSGFSMPAATKFLSASQTNAETSLCATLTVSLLFLMLRQTSVVAVTHGFRFAELFACFVYPRILLIHLFPLL